MHVLILKVKIGSYKVGSLPWTIWSQSGIRKRKSDSSCVEIKLRASIEVMGKLKNYIGEITSYM